MKLKSILLTLFALVSISSVSFAQPQGKQSYNFTRALEEAKKGNNDDAMDYLAKEVRENPNNGYAHMTMAILQADAENYNDAMTSINLASVLMLTDEVALETAAFILPRLAAKRFSAAGAEEKRMAKKKA